MTVDGCEGPPDQGGLAYDTLLAVPMDTDGQAAQIERAKVRNCIKLLIVICRSIRSRWLQRREQHRTELRRCFCCNWFCMRLYLLGTIAAGLWPGSVAAMVTLAVARLLTCWDRLRLQPRISP